jgi:hypothetical protein
LSPNAAPCSTFPMIPPTPCITALVTAPGLVGAIYIADGAIIHAEAGELKGAEAVYKLFALAGGDFSLNPYVEPPERSIDMQWEFLLSNGNSC